ncbi:unnamed protein product [Penicillium egyptiacum]|uniref:chitinase n=1 Tax=Penicillium egyptiacum TaxID=1303716 RepID=A0A9W4P9Y5_9EURO|nr:unnamed protein product [Penicillium egyptiacum]
MPSNSRRVERRLYNRQIFSCFLLVPIAIFAFFVFQNANLPRLPARFSTSHNLQDSSFVKDGETGELESRNYTRLDRRATDVNQDQSYTCTKDKPCSNGACCGESGVCGYGPTYCGTGCTSNCDAHAPCGQYSKSGISTCSLNVCCSQYGFCGTTSFQIVPMPGGSWELIYQVADAKKRNADLRVWLSIGGWTFSDNDTTTQPVFGEIAASSNLRELFAANVYSFMVQHGFDGVDLDWEYPGAGDRGGEEVDVANYPLLMQAIRSRFDDEEKDFEISFTAPSSYWYLQWFDLPKLLKYADYVNLMTYDLHGVWDKHDPFGSHIYAHTNLTEIDDSLALLWRNDVDPQKVNLGLAFYGRTFELDDPSCFTPGCTFSGAGAEGRDTSTAGILSYSEIQDLINSNEGSIFTTYDPEAGVNYMVYDRGTSWVSFDDKRTFQQKIDFANARGLNGLFIWAIDLDDDTFTALKSVTGKDLAPIVRESATLNYFDIDKCFTTPCGVDCADSFITMTDLTTAKLHPECLNGQKRQYCCPPWGAPDPSTCTWRGDGVNCRGQCNVGEVLLNSNKCGDSHSSECCISGEKAFCCPATSGAAAVSACETVNWSWQSCPAERPQQLGKVDNRALCCPKQPAFSNCAWHGSYLTCSGNRCPEGQVELAQNTNGRGGSGFTGCLPGRKQVFCCDPPFNGTAFLPVSLDNLFPEDLPAASPPVYYEAFDHSAEEWAEEYPHFDSSYTDDPNREPFAWTIMVGAEADVQSLRKRDGSHLETFNCPNPAKDDYNMQTFNAVCTVEGDDNNCEHIALGSVHGTIIRLPEECGPDEWVRVVSFREVDHSVPSRLSKRLTESPKVYEIKYDYNLRHLRRDGGEVYVRFDASVHPGYWDEIISSSPSGSVEKRSSNDWRQFHLDWFEHKLSKRGWGTSDSWWLDRFNALLDSHSNYGLQKQFHFEQILYNAAKPCPPTTAQVTAKVAGDLSVRLDYGISLIGTLRNFDFSEAYAFFNLDGLEVDSMASLDANAAFRYESEKLQLFDQWDPFAGSFNIKGLFTVGPYFDTTAQIRGAATMSGKVTTGLGLITSQPFTYMFPQSMNRFPSSSIIRPAVLTTSVEAYSKANITADGSITLTMVPSLGFQIQLYAFGERLVNTRVSTSFSNSATVRVGAGTGSDVLCGGASYGVDYSLDIDITIENPLPGWDSGTQSISVYAIDKELSPMTCYPWKVSTSKRDTGLRAISNNSTTSSLARGLAKRAETSSSVLFPDIFGGALRCPNKKKTPTGDCNASIPGWGGAGSTDTLVSKRDEEDYLSGIISPGVKIGPHENTRNFHVLEKRDRKSFEFCQGDAFMIAWAPVFPESSTLIKNVATNPFFTYGPLNPDDCDDYSYGRVPTPPQADSKNWATEHVLEWQLLADFWLDMTDKSVTDTFDDPRTKSPTTKPIKICKYLRFWWYTQLIPLPNLETARPVDLVAQAFPGTNNFRNELMLIDKFTNGAKMALWGDVEVRKDTTMQNYLKGNEGRDFNDAVNICKRVIFAMKYMTDALVSQTLVTQATRVGDYFDQVEKALSEYDDPSWNREPYKIQDYGDKWRDFMYGQWPLMVKKQKDFLDRNVKVINDYFQYDPNNAPDADGDTTMGGTEDNDKVVKRLEALNEAFNAMPNSFPNPFPASWQFT